MVTKSSLLLCCCVFLCGFTAAGAAEELVALQPEKVAIVVDGSTVAINGTAISFPAGLEEFTKLLGKPTRVIKLGNDLHTWDEHGLFVFQNTTFGDRPIGKITAMGVALDKKSEEYWPTKMFRGTLQVDGAVITAKSSFEELNRVKKGRSFEGSKFASSWTIYHDDIHLYLGAPDRKLKSEQANSSYLQITVGEDKLKRLRGEKAK